MHTSADGVAQWPSPAPEKKLLQSLPCLAFYPRRTTSVYIYSHCGIQCQHLAHMRKAAAPSFSSEVKIAMAITWDT